MNKGAVFSAILCGMVLQEGYHFYGLAGIIVFGIILASIFMVILFFEYVYHKIILQENEKEVKK